MVPREIITHISGYEPHGREMRGISTVFRDVQADLEEGRIRRLKTQYGGNSFLAVTNHNWDDVLFMLDHIDRFMSLKRDITEVARAAMTAHRYGVLARAMRLGVNLYSLGPIRGRALDVAVDTYVGTSTYLLINEIIRQGRYQLFNVLLSRGVDLTNSNLVKMAVAAASVPLPNLTMKIMGMLPEKNYYDVLNGALRSVPSICNEVNIDLDSKDRCHEQLYMMMRIARQMDVDAVATLASTHHVLPMVYWALKRGSRAYYRIIQASPYTYKADVERLINEFE